MRRCGHGRHEAPSGKTIGRTLVRRGLQVKERRAHTLRPGLRGRVSEKREKETLMIVVTAIEDDGATHQKAIGEMLSAYNAALGRPWTPLPINLRAEIDGEMAGGLAGQMIYGWLWVMLLAVAPASRGEGVGSALMREAERIARTERALGINVDTYGFQAPGFYERLGFAEVSRLPGAEPAEDRIFFAKLL